MMPFWFFHRRDVEWLAFWAGANAAMERPLDELEVRDLKQAFVKWIQPREDET